MADRISDLDGVYQVHLISGEYDMLEVWRKSIEGVGALIIDRIREVRGVGRTLTCASFAQIKERDRWSDLILADIAGRDSNDSGPKICLAWSRCQIIIYCDDMELFWFRCTFSCNA